MGHEGHSLKLTLDILELTINSKKRVVGGFLMVIL